MAWFNLYHPAHRLTSSHGFVFTFSTLKWEHRGLALSIVTFVVALLAIRRLALRERRRHFREARGLRGKPGRGRDGRARRSVSLALCGLAVVLAWFGIPSRFPSVAITSDPYNLDIVFGTVALALLASSLVVRLGDHFVHRLRARDRQRVPVMEPNRRRQLAAVAGVSAAVAVLAASCNSGSSHTANQAYAAAQQAGATSRLISGYTLEDAQIQSQANDTPKCIADYTSALKAYPRMAAAYYGRAQCYQSGGLDYPAAVHDYDRALSLSPGNPEYLLEGLPPTRASETWAPPPATTGRRRRRQPPRPRRYWMPLTGY